MTAENLQCMWAEKPVGRTQTVHDILSGGVAEGAVAGPRSKSGFMLKRWRWLPCFSMARGQSWLMPTSTWVRSWSSLRTSNSRTCVKGLGVAVVEGEALVVRLAVVEALPDAAHAGDAQGADAEHVGGAEVVDVGGDPAAFVELPEVRGGLVVVGHEEGRG